MLQPFKRIVVLMENKVFCFSKKVLLKKGKYLAKVSPDVIQFCFEVFFNALKFEAEYMPKHRIIKKSNLSKFQFELNFLYKSIYTIYIDVKISWHVIGKTRKTRKTRH